MASSMDNHQHHGQSMLNCPSHLQKTFTKFEFLTQKIFEFVPLVTVGGEIDVGCVMGVVTEIVLFVRLEQSLMDLDATLAMETGE